MKRRKPNIKQRIERKYMFAHGEMIKNFTQEEVENMHITLSNTFRNATLPIPGNKQKKSANDSLKKVTFNTSGNIYYDPPNHAQNE